MAELEVDSRFETVLQDCVPVVEYSYTCVPTYTSGQLGMFVCAKNEKANVKTPLRSWSKTEELTVNKYYNTEMHEASFVLPTWARKELDV